MRHGFDIRRPHVLPEHCARRNHILLHLGDLQFPIRELPLRVALALLRLPWAASLAKAARTVYGLKSRIMMGVGVRSSIVTARCPAVVVIQRIDAGSNSNQRVAEMPRADHGTRGGALAPGAERKGAQARCACGICARSARRCTKNVKGRVSWKNWAACMFVSLISRLKSTIASAALSRNSRRKGAGLRSGLGLVGLGSAWQPRRMIEACGERGWRPSVHRGTTRGMSSSMLSSTTILTISRVFCRRLGMTSVSSVRKLKYAYAPHSEERN